VTKELFEMHEREGWLVGVDDAGFNLVRMIVVELLEQLRSEIESGNWAVMARMEILSLL
jgi:hypothetical protein